MDVPDELLRGVVETTPAEVAVLDAEGTIVYTNEAWREFGRENDCGDEAVFHGQNYLEACAASDDEFARRSAARLREVYDGNEDVVRLEYPCHSPDEKRWFTMYAKPFRFEGEQYVHVSHIDITDRKLAELDVAEKNERLEAVASVLSHDLRNPLAVALGYLEQLEGMTDRFDTPVDKIRSALNRMETMIEDALLLARPSELETTEAIDLETIARGAWSHVRSGDAELIVEETTAFRADASIVENLLENLFRNSVDHAAGGDREPVGPLSVRVGSLPGGFYVEDDGVGIPPAAGETVFEIGFSTGGGDNTGLGLAIVSEIAAAHDWEVALEESDAGGARFEFRGVEPLT